MSIANQQQLLKDQKLCFVIFGASGDLALRMLIPSLETISCYNPFHDETKIIGVARTQFKDDDFKKRLIDGIRQFSRIDTSDENASGSCEIPEYFMRRVEYISGEYTDPETYKKLKASPDNKEDILTPNTEASDDREFFYIQAATNAGKRILIFECRPQLISTILRYTRRNILESEFNRR